jgi:hypothetical protein
LIGEKSHLTLTTKDFPTEKAGKHISVAALPTSNFQHFKMLEFLSIA